MDLTGKPARPIQLKNAMDPKSIARLADYPTPPLVSPVRKIVFKILAHDQGWGGEGGDNEYDNSWTWFEAGLERFEAGMIGKFVQDCQLESWIYETANTIDNRRGPTR